jgi:hypothetical protein
MNSNFSLPDYRTIRYYLNPESGKYEKQPERIPFSKLPNELKVEETWEERIRSNGANNIITGRIKQGKREFFTGLIPVAENTWFMGNDYSYRNGAKTNSLVVFHFSDDNTSLTVYYFNKYYKVSRQERISFVIHFIETLLKKSGESH